MESETYQVVAESFVTQSHEDNRSIGCQIILKTSAFPDNKVSLFTGTHEECIDFARTNCTDCTSNEYPSKINI